MRSSHDPRSSVARQPEATAEATLRYRVAKHDACQMHKPLILDGLGSEQQLSGIPDAEDLLARHAGLAIFCAGAPRRSGDCYRVQKLSPGFQTLRRLSQDEAYPARAGNDRARRQSPA